MFVVLFDPALRVVLFDPAVWVVSAGVLGTVVRGVRFAPVLLMLGTARFSGLQNLKKKKMDLQFS